MKKSLVIVVVLVLLIISSFPVSAQEDDCTWLCQVVEWFKGSETVAGKAGANVV